MTLKATVLDALLAAGASAEMIIAAIKADAVEDEERKARKREKNAERQRRYRLSRSVTRDNALVTLSNGDIPPAPPPEVSPTPSSYPSPLPPKEKSPKGDQKKTPAEVLANVLDAEHASAVVEHRARLRKPLTAHAAKLLANKFAEAPEPNAAADAMILNGWQGFDQEWLDNNRQRGPPRVAGNGKRQPHIFDALDRVINEQPLEHPEQQPPHVAPKRDRAH
jgi:hypothetical protein